MLPSKGYAAQSTTSGLAPFSFERRDPREGDVVVEILYSGICHSDIHQVRDEWGGSFYPMVPGHEIVGRVAKVGPGVTRLKVSCEGMPPGSFRKLLSHKDLALQ